MLRAVLLYAVSTGLSRGVGLLCLPLLTKSLSLGDYGWYGLVQTGVLLGAPLLSLNGAAAVLREGADDEVRAIAVLARFLGITIAIGGSASIVAYTVAPASAGWITVGVLVAVSEALHQLAQSALRALDHGVAYLVFSVLKVVGYVLFLMWAQGEVVGLTEILVGQASWYSLLGVVTIAALLTRSRRAPTPPLRELLVYTLPLIPHLVAQWVMSGSDRFVVLALLGEESAGLYNLTYTLALPVMLLNSGLAMVIPQHVIRNYPAWQEGGVRRRILRTYSLAVTAGVMLLLAALELDRRHFHLVRYYDPSIPLFVAIIATGLYFLGIYYLFGNYYVYHRRTGALAIQTLITAVVHLPLTWLLVEGFGLLGAAISTAITYAVYLALVIYGARQLEGALGRSVWREAALAGPVATVLIAAGWLLGQSW